MVDLFSMEGTSLHGQRKRPTVWAALGSALAATAALLAVLLSPTLPATGAAGGPARAPALGHAKACATVPSVVGEDVATAAATLRAAGLRPLLQGHAAGTVYRQSPGAGARAMRGSGVRIWVTK